MYDMYSCKVSRYANHFIKVDIPNELNNKILSFAKQLAEAKFNEAHHKEDHNKAEQRFITGLRGEAALEQFLGIPIIDWEIGHSAFYNKPDIPGYNIGVKTVEYGKFPVIPKLNTYAQIICLVTNTGSVFICGLGTPEVLNQYQNDDLILDPCLKNRNIKTCFDRFDKLQWLKSKEDLNAYRKEA